MLHSFGTVRTDDAPRSAGVSAYIFFACSVTGRNGELWGNVASSALAKLQAMEPDLAQAILRESGNLVGGDATDRFFRLVSMQPWLDSRGRLRFPGKLTLRDAEPVFVDAAGRALPVHTRSLWRNRAGEVTGIGLGRTRDFLCGCDAGAPEFYGTEHEHQEATHIVAFGQSTAAQAASAAVSPPAVRRRPHRR